MSEFTEVILFLKKNTEIVVEQVKTLPCHFLLREINEKWSALLTEYDSPNHSLEQWLYTASQKTPLLHFFDAEEEGWSYIVYADGGNTAHVSVGYELDFGMVLDLIEVRYPEVDDPMDWHSDRNNRQQLEQLYEEVKNSEAYRTALIEQYKERNVRSLGIFEISEDTLQKLETNLTVDYYGYDQVGTFKTLMGFPEVSWMRYSYLIKEMNEEEDDDEDLD